MTPNEPDFRNAKMYAALQGGLGKGQSAGQPLKRQSHVAEELHMLDKAAEALDVTFNDLLDHLTPVLNRSAGTEPTKGETPFTEIVPLASAIRDIRIKIEAVAERIGLTISTTEL